jgi:hypothetical protein
MGMGFIAKKTIVWAYEFPIKPFDDIGVIALDSRLRIRSISRPDGSTVYSSRKTIGGLGIINTAEDVQIHLLPGEYILSTCFRIDTGNQFLFCNTPLALPISVHAMQWIQLSWAPPDDNGGWRVLQQPVTDAVRERILQDFSKIMEAK